jgi:hypothetical protein
MVKHPHIGSKDVFVLNIYRYNLLEITNGCRFAKFSDPKFLPTNRLDLVAPGFFIPALAVPPVCGGPDEFVFTPTSLVGVGKPGIFRFCSGCLSFPPTLIEAAAILISRFLYWRQHLSRLGRDVATPHPEPAVGARYVASSLAFSHVGSCFSATCL